MSDSVYTFVYKDPLHLTNADQALLQITPQIFAGKSFLHCSHNICIALITKNKLGFINGSFPKPAKNHANYSDWIRTDYTLRKDVINIAQGDACVAEYYAKFRSIWEDMRALDPLPQSNAPAQFLRKLLTEVNQAFAKVHQAKVQQSITEEASSSVQPEIALNATTVHPRSHNFSGGSNVWQRDSKRPNNEHHDAYYCTHCNKGGHSHKFCWSANKHLKPKHAAPRGKYAPNSAGGGNRRMAANIKEAPGDYVDDDRTYLYSTCYHNI
ncbi:uncharacterized protein LOC141651287 [Silene latifolia]|uniref:uncharacterized protein LOC141651287 n=1 Tax=Silene latifolia TaxID=37657 RepID=UPI003D77E2A9